MNKITRLGILILVTGISLGLATLSRGSTPNSGISGYLLPSEAWTSLHEELWNPRHLRIEIESETEINLYILDAAGIKQWRNTNEIEAIFSFENTADALYTVTVNKRGTYALLIYNPSNSDTNIRINMTFHGFEIDLLWTSRILAILGIIVIYLAISLAKPSSVQKPN